MIYPAFSRNQGNPLSSSSMMRKICPLESHRSSVAVVLGQISLTPSAAWSLKILQLITLNRSSVTLPQCYKPEHKSLSETNVWSWAAQRLLLVPPSAENISQMYTGFYVFGKRGQGVSSISSFFILSPRSTDMTSPWFSNGWKLWYLRNLCPFISQGLYIKIETTLQISRRNCFN